MLCFKKGVNICNITPHLVLAMIVVDQVFDELGSQLMITSVDDGVHGKKTLHGKGRAFDCRIWYLDTKQQLQACQIIRQRLGPHFDVVLEPDHIHIEYDPKEAAGA